MITNPTYDTYHEPSDDRINERRITVKPASTIDDVLRVFSIRSATYISEQQCPYDEEFDGNDFCSSHLLGYVDEEPAGCLRIRAFSNFAKIERLAVRPEFRKSGLSTRLARAGIDMAHKKGFTLLYGHSTQPLLRFWMQFGFKLVEKQRELIFSDFRYYEICLELPPHPDPITIDSDPHVILRPEGHWHRPGRLELSSARGATAPRRVAGH